MSFDPTCSVISRADVTNEPIPPAKPSGEPVPPIRRHGFGSPEGVQPADHTVTRKSIILSLVTIADQAAKRAARDYSSDDTKEGAAALYRAATKALSLAAQLVECEGGAT